MAKVLITDEISQEGLRILEETASVSYCPQISQDQLIGSIGEYEGILVRSRTAVTAAVIAAGQRLKIIGRAGVGVDNIDLPAATRAGILVVNSPEGNTASAAEHTMALLLSLARLVPAADTSVKEGRWERGRFVGSELFNKTLAIIGLGKIGSRVARTAQALGMKILVCDPLVSQERAQHLNMQRASLEEIWGEADFITIHTPKTRQTAHMINRQVLSQVKPGLRIVNTARGGLIDEEALAEAIAEGRVAGAAIDVFSQEPPTGSPLLTLGDRVILTPHLGASTLEAQFNVAIDLAEQIRDFLKGGMVRSPVNLPSMRPDVLKALGKYIWLAEAMGAIAGCLADGNVLEVELMACGSLAGRDTEPLAVAALKGVFSGRVESVTYVNAHLVAKEHGISVRESRFEESNQHGDEICVIVRTSHQSSEIAGTVLAHNQPIITRINGFPINLTPARYMLFTTHRDQPGMVARVAGLLGDHDINISTMSVGRKQVRQEAVMVMTLDDPVSDDLVGKLASLGGLHTAAFVALDHIAAPLL